MNDGINDDAQPKGWWVEEMEARRLKAPPDADPIEWLASHVIHFCDENEALKAELAMSTPNGTPHQDAPRTEFEQWVVNQIEELNDATNGTLLNQEAQLETLRRKVAWLDSRITDLVDQLNGWEVSVDLPSKLSKVSADIRDLRADMELVHRAFPTEIGEQRNVRALGPREQGPPESPEEQLDSFEAMREKVRVEAHADQDPIEYLLDQVASARTGFRLLRRKR